MITLEQLRAWRAAAPNFLARQRKTVGQARYGWDHPKQVTFVFGCQRSGTKMVMRVLERSPATRIYHENHATAFRDFQLRSDAVVRSLVALNPAPAQVFKPICDSQEADHLLERFPSAHGLWVYRHYDDVANSAFQKWGAHQCELVAAVVSGDMSRWGWRTARLPESVVADLRRVYRPDLRPEEGALLFWYMRNAFFFALGLDRHPRARLIRYESLVTEPERAFREVFDFAGAPFDPGFLDRVRATSIGRREPPAASPEIRALCADLYARLEAWRAPAPAPASAPMPGSVVSPILMVINTLGVGGAERYAVTVANWLADRGGEVTIAASCDELANTFVPGVRYVYAPLERVRADLPKVAAQLRTILDDTQPKAIIAHSLMTTLVARAALVGRPAVPIVNVAHGWPDDKYRLVAPAMRAADAVVAVSPEVRAKLVGGGLDPSRCTVILNGVDCRPLGRRSGPDRAAVRASLGAEPEHLLVVTLGRLEAQKAQQHLITVASLLRESHPALRYAIVGEGSRLDELRGLAQAAGVADRVRLVGLRNDVPEVLAAADLYLSTSDWEGMPLSTIEAMASALPVVATRTEGSGHLLEAGVGVLVPVGDAPAIADAVAALASDPAARLRMGDAARARALADFSHDRMAGELAALVARLAG